MSSEARDYHFTPPISAPFITIPPRISYIRRSSHSRSSRPQCRRHRWGSSGVDERHSSPDDMRDRQYGRHIVDLNWKPDLKCLCNCYARLDRTRTSWKPRDKCHLVIRFPTPVLAYDVGGRRCVCFDQGVNNPTSNTLPLTFKRRWDVDQQGALVRRRETWDRAQNGMLLTEGQTHPHPNCTILVELS